MCNKRGLHTCADVSLLHVQITEGTADNGMERLVTFMPSEGTALAKNICLLRTLLPVVDSSHQYYNIQNADWCCVPGSTLITITGALFLKWQRTHLTALSTLASVNQQCLANAHRHTHHLPPPKQRAICLLIYFARTAKRFSVPACSFSGACNKVRTWNYIDSMYYYCACNLD